MNVSRTNLLVPVRLILLAGALVAVFGGFMFAARLSSAQDARPRRTASTAIIQPTPAASPTPVPVKPATQPNGNRSQTQTPTPGVDRIAPQLGEPPPPPRLKPKPTPTPEEFDPTDANILRTNTQLVTLNVRVIDRTNRPIDNVRQSDFHIYEDGVAQPVEIFSKEEVPISYGLAVDTSLSLRNQLQSVIDAAKTIINSNKRGDETFIERFISSDKINVEKDFTANKDELIETIDNLYLEGGQTAVIDGVYLASEHVAEYRKGDDSDRRRRALIVITDGEDRHSFYTETQLFQRLREEDVQIFIIGFVNELDKEAAFIKKSPRDKAVSLITRFAADTGGRAFFPQSVSELPEIANAIIRDMRTQYVLAYSPTNTAHDGSYRTIRVTVEDGPNRDKRIALTRAGYNASREGSPSTRAPANRTGTAARPGNSPVRSP